MADGPRGVVYTPPAIARPMVALALAPLVEGATAAAIRALRVCDPACGTGAFLVEVIDYLAAALHARGVALAEARRIVAAECVFGVDLDAAAVAAARELTPSVVCADALAREWPERFDAVLANPPYIRQESLAGKAALRTYESYSGVADLYVYFVELAHRILRPGGRYCVIVPTKWRSAAYGRGLRAFLASQNTVEGIVELAAGQGFATADAYPCIVWGTAAPRVEPVRASRADPQLSVAEALVAPGTPHDRARFTAEPWTIETRAERALLDRLERDFPPLADVVPGRPARGVVTGCNRAFVVDRATRDALARDPDAAALLRPFVKGRDLRAFATPEAERWLLLVDRGTPLPRALEDHLAAFRTELEPRAAGSSASEPGRKPGPYRWCELQDPVGPLIRERTPRILYQDIQTSPIACLDETGALVPDTTVWMLPSTDRALLALLTSPLYAWYARRRFPPALNGSVRPKLEYMRKLPVARAPDIAPLVDARIAGDTSLDAELADRVAAAYRLTAAERLLVQRG